MGRNIAEELRELVRAHMLTTSPLGEALLAIADSIESQQQILAAQEEMRVLLCTRIERLEAEVLPRDPDPEIGLP